ncbi:MAG TPA: hypothetical protein VJ553_01315, partial [Candidatus Paceibacterota bacterium]|nr:hypothetical protein [Candidatus Paceibacterota bacterium]
MKALIKPQPCDEVVTHWNPHPDEGLGYFLGKRFAKHIFRGIENAKLVLLNAGQRPPNGVSVQQYEKTRLVLGTCLGRYDEHGLNEDVRSRYAASSLVARDQGLTEDPALKPILEYTVDNDRNAHRATWDIASIMFGVNVLLLQPENAQITLDLAYDWFDVAYDYFAMRIKQGEKPTRPKGELSLNDYIVSWLIQAFDFDHVIASSNGLTARQVAETLGIADRPELKRILELSERKHTEGPATDFDIYTFVEMAVVTGHSNDWIYERLALMFNARRREEKLFYREIDTLPETASFVQIWRNPANPEVPIFVRSTPADREAVHQTWAKKQYKLLFTIGIVESDSPVAHKAFRYKHRMDVMIIRKTNGYTAINIGRLPRGPFAFRLRKAESNSEYLTMDELLRDGNTYDPDGRQRPWCNFKEGGWLLNGAFTALDQKQLP